MSFLINNSRKKNNMTENDISFKDTNFTNNSNYSHKNLILKNLLIKDKISYQKNSIRKKYFETEFRIPSLIAENNDSISSSILSSKNNSKIKYKKFKSKTSRIINNNYDNNNYYNNYRDKRNKTFFQTKLQKIDLNLIKTNLNEKINLTLPNIKKEIINIHKFILNSPISTDEKIIINNLKIKNPIKYDKNSTNFYNFKTRIQPINNKSKKKIEENSKIYKIFINSVNNPSLGLEGIKKKFPNFAN